MAKKQSNSWVGWIIALIVLGGAGYFYWQYRQKAESASAAVSYRTNVISRGDIVQMVTANGALTPMTNVQVGSQVSGIIRELYADFNSRVTNGQVIARIDPSTYEQSLTLAEAELENAKAALVYAELNQKRTAELRKNDLVSSAEYEKTQADLQQAQAIVRMRDASVKRAKVDLEKTTVYAPVDGVVISRAVDIGQTVAASLSAPVLYQIANDLRQMRIEAMVSEADVGGIEEGQDVRFNVDAFPARQFRGKVSQVRFAPITNQNVVSYTTIVEVNNDDLKLRPGMTATAQIITAEKKDVMRVPDAAFRFRPQDSTMGKPATPAANTMTGKAPSGEQPTRGPMVGGGGGAGGSGGGPGGRGGEGGGPSEEMRRRFQNMSPEEREQMRARFAAGGGRMGGGRRGGAAEQEGPVTRTVYVLDSGTTPDGKPNVKAVTIKTGISDGTNTEVIEGLKEGDVVVTGLNAPLTPAGPAAGGASSPFGGGGFGGGRRPGR